MTSQIVLLGVAFLMTAAPLFAQDTSASKDSAYQEIQDWLRARAVKVLEEHKSEVARGSAGKQGQLKIVSLADMDAPAAVTSSVKEGIIERSRGPLLVASGTIPSTAEVVAGLANARRNDAELEQRLGYAPADVSQTPISAAELLSTEPSGAINGATSTGVSRTYRVPKVGVVILSEDDYHASGTELTVIREALNEDVNGVPAVAYSARSEDGMGKAEVRWVTAQRAYSLTLLTDDGRRIEQGQALLLQIARGMKS